MNEFTIGKWGSSCCCWHCCIVWCREGSSSELNLYSTTNQGQLNSSVEWNLNCRNFKIQLFGLNVWCTVYSTFDKNRFQFPGFNGLRVSVRSSAIEGAALSNPDPTKIHCVCLCAWVPKVKRIIIWWILLPVNCYNLMTTDMRMSSKSRVNTSFQVLCRRGSRKCTLINHLR